MEGAGTTARQASEGVASEAAAHPLLADLVWLEQYATQRKADPEEVVRLRLAEALIGNSLLPWLAGSRGKPLQVAVVGGAGAGKSTVSNFLVGQPVAETNPQAGFTRHPIAYVQPGGPQPRTTGPARLGRLKFLPEPQPSSLDEDVFQVRTVNRVPGPAGTPAGPANPQESTSLLTEAVVWDCPDMTTWQAHHYAARLVEIVGLADVVVYAASDERYNDAIPTQFLRMILAAGKPVVTVLLKMKPDQTERLVDHFRKEVVARIPECTKVSACLAIPHLTAEELKDPPARAGRYQQPLLEAVGWYLKRPEETRLVGAKAAADFLVRQHEELLRPARRDLDALCTWQRLVKDGQRAFTGRYVNEYLTGEQFPRFNASLVRLMELLELPGAGQVISKALWVVRTPFRLVKGAIQKATGTAPVAGIPEEPVLRAAFTAWLDSFRKEAAVKSGHPLWEQLKANFDRELQPEATAELTKHLAEFQTRMTAEVDGTARAIYEELEKNPTALNTLRGTKAAIELASIAGTVVFLGTHFVMDLVLVPLVAAFTQELVEVFGKSYVDRQREKTRDRQREVFEETLARPLASWLQAWPAHGSTSVEHLQGVVDRVPRGFKQLQEQVLAAAGGATP